MRSLFGLAVLVACCAVEVLCNSTYSPLRPPAIPLAVASPYLSTWLGGDTLPGTWPVFWTGQVTGWQGYVSVDGIVYSWMGAATLTSNRAVQTSFTYTSTRSVFVLDVEGEVELTAMFLTPVYPNDLAKKALQFSYVDVSAVSKDGASHEVKIYMDVTGEFMAGDRSKVIEWDTGTRGGIRYHRFWNQHETQFEEVSDQAQWGTFILSTTLGEKLTFMIGQDTTVRGKFVQTSTLEDTVDGNFRQINEAWPVFAFAQDLGTLGSAAVHVQFGLGLNQEFTVNFQGAKNGTEALRGNWMQRWSDGISAMADWMAGYADEASYATTIDDLVQTDALAAGGGDYAAIASLAVRQAFGSLQPAYSDAQSFVFLKEISSDGDTSTVDVIFPTFPILTYFNETLVKLLLDPLYINQESGAYPNTYAEHDLGSFPNALGYSDGKDEAMPVEECGNMIIMTLSYAQRTGDTAYLSAHYDKLVQWAGYLMNDSLVPVNQLSTDDFAGSLANQTNLALKGIIGVAAMGQIARLTAHQDTYTAMAESYIAQWYALAQNVAASPKHIELAYGDLDSWGLLYNLFADKLLGLGLVSESIYAQQSAFYASKLGNYSYGVPLDTRHTYTKVDWESWVAAIASPDVRAAFFNTVRTWLGKTSSRVPFTDWYYADSGEQAGFMARPVVGGVFAYLIL